MSKEELSSIQELIERKILLAEVNRGLTSSDKKFISLWNYTIELLNSRDSLKQWIKEMLDDGNDIFSVVRVKDVLEKLEMED